MAERRRLTTLGAAMLVGLAVAGCSDGDDEPQGPLTTTAPTIPTAPTVPAPSAPGTGLIVIGGGSSPFEVTSCALEPDPAAPEGARALLVADGAGTTADGVDFTVEVQRFATTLNEVVTYTDTIAYTDAARILQAQRVEVNGQVTDLREPRAAGSLLRLRADGVSGAGLAGPPGGDADEGGLVGIALDLTCG